MVQGREQWTVYREYIEESRFAHTDNVCKRPVFLEAFHIPEDYQEKLLETHRRLNAAYDDTESHRKRLLTALERLKEMYKWGDKSRDQYLAESREIEEELSSIERPAHNEDVISKLAQFLKDMSSGWREADQDKRNKLARALFESVWIEDQSVLGVTPRPELKPFFDLAYSELSSDVLQWRPRPDSNRRSLP